MADVSEPVEEHLFFLTSNYLETGMIGPTIRIHEGTLLLAQPGTSLAEIEDVSFDLHNFGDYFCAWIALSTAWAGGIAYESVVRDPVGGSLWISDEDGPNPELLPLVIADLCGLLAASLARSRLLPDILAGLLIWASPPTLEIPPSLVSPSLAELIEIHRRQFVRGRLSWADRTLAAKLGDSNAALAVRGMDEHLVSETPARSGAVQLRFDFAELLPLLIHSSKTSDVMEFVRIAGIGNSDVAPHRVSVLPVEDTLRALVRTQPDSATIHLSLGVLLGLTNRLDEALPHLEKGLGAEDGGSTLLANYWYTDCLAGIETEPGTGLVDYHTRYTEGRNDKAFEMGIIAFLVEQLEFQPDVRKDFFDWYTGIEKLLLIRGLSVAEGQELPICRRSAIPSQRVGREKRIRQPFHRIGEEQILQVLESMRVGQEQHRTENIAGFRAMSRALDASDFWIQRVSQLLQPERRNQIQTELEEVLGNDWTLLPETARSQLIAAKYVDDDPALEESESAAGCIRALGLCVETIARASLRLGTGADLGSILKEMREFQWTPEIVRRVDRLRILRNEASHSGRVSREDAKSAWSLAFGTSGEQGLIALFAHHESD